MTSLSNNQIQLVVNKIVNCFDLASKAFDQEFVLPDFRFHHNGTTCGMAHVSQHGDTISLHETLMAHNFDDMLCNTVPHEVSHIVTTHVFGKKVRPHGREWKHVMADVMRVEPRVYHSYDVSVLNVRRQQRITYLCGCRSHEVSATIHHKIVRGKQYTCKTCACRLIKKTR